jgi:hypothetical protein
VRSVEPNLSDLDVDNGPAQCRQQRMVRHQVVLKREDGSGILRPIIAHA